MLQKNLFDQEKTAGPIGRGCYKSYKASNILS